MNRCKEVVISSATKCASWGRIGLIFKFATQETGQMVDVSWYGSHQPLLGGQDIGHRVCDRSREKRPGGFRAD